MTDLTPPPAPRSGAPGARTSRGARRTDDAAPVRGLPRRARRPGRARAGARARLSDVQHRLVRGRRAAERRASGCACSTSPAMASPTSRAGGATACGATPSCWTTTSRRSWAPSPSSMVAHDRGDSVALIHAAQAAEERARVTLEHLVLSNGNIFLPLSNLTDAQRLMLHDPEVLEQLTPELLAAGMGAADVHAAARARRPRGAGACRDVRARRRHRRAARDDPVPASSARSTSRSGCGRSPPRRSRRP